MTGTFFECDVCGLLLKEPNLGDAGLPNGWIRITLQVPDWYEYTGFYWEEFHVCSYECAHRLAEAKKADRDKYREETKPKKPTL